MSDREQEAKAKEEGQKAQQTENEAITNESIKDMAAVAQEFIKDARFEPFRVLFETMMKGYEEMNTNQALQESEQKSGLWVIKQSVRTGAANVIRDLILGSPNDFISRWEEIEASRKLKEESKKKYYLKSQGGVS